MKNLMKVLAVLLLSTIASGQTTTTYSGVIRDLSQNVVTSGQVTFELRPSYDSTISGFARFTPSTITCSINQATAGTSAAVRATNSVTISGLTGHTFVTNDIVTVTGMTDSTFNGTFTIGSTTGTSITYPQTAGNATTGSGVIAALRSTPGPGSCTVTMNTALNPSGTSYRVCIQPNFISPGSCFNDYAVAATKDITTVVPTPTTSPAYTFVDLHSAQTIDGNKTFTGSTSFTGSLSLGALSLSSLSVSGLSTLNGGTLNGTYGGNPTLSGNVSVGGTLGVTGAATFGGGNPWFDVTSGVFGAKCDGVTDDRIPIQATIAAAELFGGNVFIPDGKTCVVATNSSPALNLDQALNVSILCGVAGGKSRPGGGLTNVCQLKFTGTPAVALSARSSFGVVINGVALTASNAAFSGTIIDTSHVSIQDTQNFGLLNSTVTGTSTSCSIGVSLDKAIDSNVTNSHFFGCTAQVKGASASGSYSNNNKIRDNDFNGGTGVAAFIRNPGKTTDISANTFELNAGANLIDFSGSFADCGGTSVEKNLINDLSGTPTFTMISVPCSAFSVNKNNFQIIDANATAIAVSDNVANFSAKGNAFCAGTFATLFALGTADVVDIREDACSFTVTNFLTGTPAAGSQVVDSTARTTNYGAVAMPTSLQVGAGTTFTGSVGTGTSIASNSAVQTFVQACSGTATAGTTLALQWAGGACTSSATALQAPTSTAGTLLNLRVKCGTGGVNASSGVFTLEKNGANATALTCTMGTGTACADTTHTVAAAAGDTWQMFFTTQGAETLANCAASWEKQ